MKNIAEVVDKIREESREEGFIDSNLSSGQKAVVRDKEDLVYVAIVERIINHYQGIAIMLDMDYSPVDQEHYNQLQSSWISDEMNLARIDLGHEPSHAEFKRHWELFRNGLRFRLFYFLKYTDKMVGIVDFSRKRDFGYAA